MSKGSYFFRAWWEIVSPIVFAYNVEVCNANHGMLVRINLPRIIHMSSWFGHLVWNVGEHWVYWMCHNLYGEYWEILSRFFFHGMPSSWFFLYDYVMCNLDVAIFSTMKKVGMAVCIRDVEWHFKKTQYLLHKCYVCSRGRGLGT